MVNETVYAPIYLDPARLDAAIGLSRYLEFLQWAKDRPHLKLWKPAWDSNWRFIW